MTKITFASLCITLVLLTSACMTSSKKGARKSSAGISHAVTDGSYHPSSDAQQRRAAFSGFMK